MEARARSAAAWTMVLGLVLAGCGGGAGDGDFDQDTGQAAGTYGEERSPRTQADTRGAPADTVDVSLVEYQVEMPGSVPAGPTVFRVTNDGSEEHSFEVEGQGTEEVFDSNLMPGETRTLRVDLRAGTYEVYCPVGDHAQRGMQRQLRVTR